MPEMPEMPENQFFPVDDPEAVAGMASHGGVPSAEVSTINAWYDDPRYKDIKDEILQAKIMTRGQFARKYGESFNPEDEYKDRFANDDEVQKYFDDKLNADDVKTKEIDNRVWVERAGRWVRIEFADVRNGEVPTTFIEGEEPKEGDEVKKREEEGENGVDAERKENTLNRESFVEAIRLMMYSNNENRDLPTDGESAKTEKRRRREGKPTAIALLRNNGVDVDYLMGSTEIAEDDPDPGKTRSERRKKVKMVNAGIARKELIYTEEVDDILVRMNVDDKKLSEWGITAGTKTEIGPEPGRPGDPGPVDPDIPGHGERTERKEEKGKRKLTEYLAKQDVNGVRLNEIELNEMFLVNWSPNLVTRPDRLVKYKTHLIGILECSRHPDASYYLNYLRGNANDTNILSRAFVIAQNEYVGHIIGGDWINRALQVRNDISVSATNINRKSVKDIFDFNKRVRDYNSRIETKAYQISKSTERAWDGIGMDENMMSSRLVNFLDSKLGLLEIERHTDNISLINQYLTDYIPSQQFATWVERKSSDDQNMTEEEKRLLISFSAFREFTYNFDVHGKIEEKSSVEVDKGLRDMVLLKNESTGRPLYPVAESILIYQQILYQVSRNYPERAVDIDSVEVQREFKNKYTSLFGDETFLNLSMVLARDVVRLTGIDVKYSLSRTRDAEGKVKGVESNRGGLLRDVLNFKRLLYEDQKNDQLLVDDIDLGVVPFWNKTRGGDALGTSIDHVDFGSVREILDTFSANLPSGGKNLKDWSSLLVEKIKPTIDAEKDFLKNPTIEKFVDTIPKVYGYKKDKAKNYLKGRFSSVLKYSARTISLRVLETKLTKLFMSDNVWDDKGVFVDENEFFETCRENNVMINIDGIKRESENAQRYNARLERARNNIVGRFVKRFFK